MEALKIAQDFQATGAVKDEDISLAHDNTPAANKVDRKQVEEGNLVRVVMQALEKRLGKSGPIQPLSGPETSATSMAIDFLIQELDGLLDSATTSLPATEINAHPVETAQEAERQRRMEAARLAMMDDLMGDQQDRMDDMDDIMFGKGGIPDKAPDNAAVIDFDVDLFS
jgi:hypothetical protein